VSTKRRLVGVLLLAVIGAIALAAVGMIAGDPRGATDLDRALSAVLDGVGVVAATGLVAWWLTGGRRRWWALPLVVVGALVGGLVGWISMAEILGAPTEPAVGAARALAMAGTTAATAVVVALIMSGLAAALHAIVRATRRGRAET
jgi:hypothetical protein